MRADITFLHCGNLATSLAVETTGGLQGVWHRKAMASQSLYFFLTGCSFHSLPHVLWKLSTRGKS